MRSYFEALPATTRRHFTPLRAALRATALGATTMAALSMLAAAWCSAPAKAAPVAVPTPAVQGTSGLPRHIDARASYLIFLHGRIVEEHGTRPTDPRFGVYDYQGILDSLTARGFTVIGEVRPTGTEIGAYADHVVAQVRALLAAGVPARRIAVVGFSKGGSIALVAASRLHHPEVRFVSLAGCGDWLFKELKVELGGPVLSLYDEADDVATSCAMVLVPGRNADRRREIVLHVGKGHGTFYRPDSAWLDPLAAWLGGG